jgi:hypothetical protein
MKKGNTIEIFVHLILLNMKKGVKLVVTILEALKMLNTMNFEGKPYTIEEILDMYDKGQINLNPEYQRGDVWKKAFKQQLIDSILKPSLIGTLLFHRRDDNKFDVIDGQQRLRAIISFYKGEFSTSPQITDGEPISFENIESDSKKFHEFLSYKISVNILTNFTDEEIREFFIRTNTGSPLTNAEKLHAVNSYLNQNYIQAWINHPIFKKVGIDNTRSNLEFNMLKIFDSETRSPKGMRTVKQLPKNYIKEGEFNYYKRVFDKNKYNDDNFPHNECKRITKNLDTLLDVLDGNYKIINRKINDFVAVYFLFSNLNEMNLVNFPNNKKINEFLNNFFENVNECRNRNNLRKSHKSLPESDVERKYGIYLKKGSILHKVQPINFLIGEFLNAFPDMESKDPQRAYNHYQKLAMYNRAQGKCQNCNSEISLDNAIADHINRHSDGGLTTLNNGQILCEDCHNKKTSNENRKA